MEELMKCVDTFLILSGIVTIIFITVVVAIFVAERKNNSNR